jgi:hypothetical protein
MAVLQASNHTNPFSRLEFAAKAGYIRASFGRESAQTAEGATPRERSGKKDRTKITNLESGVQQTPTEGARVVID